MTTIDPRRTPRLLALVALLGSTLGACGKRAPCDLAGTWRLVSTSGSSWLPSGDLVITPTERSTYPQFCWTDRLDDCSSGYLEVGEQGDTCYISGYSIENIPPFESARDAWTVKGDTLTGTHESRLKGQTSTELFTYQRE